MKTSETVITVFARLALGFSFLSAVADRFGLWGAYGAPHVAWGDFGHFIAYTAKLNWFVPQPMIPTTAWLATCAEITLGAALILGIFTRIAAVLSGLLLLMFSLSMTVALGLKSALDASVFSASAAAFLLATADRYPFSADSIVWRQRQVHRQEIHSQIGGASHGSASGFGQICSACKKRPVAFRDRRSSTSPYF